MLCTHLGGNGAQAAGGERQAREAGQRRQRTAQALLVHRRRQRPRLPPGKPHRQLLRQDTQPISCIEMCVD